MHLCNNVWGKGSHLPGTSCNFCIAMKRAQHVCPGEPVTRRCVNCEALVSTQAFHRKDTLTTFLVGESVLGWPKAHAALKKVPPCPDAVTGVYATPSCTMAASYSCTRKAAIIAARIRFRAVAAPA